jgi:hypothetical protein
VLILGRIELRAFIDDACRVAYDAKPVSKTRGDIKLPFVLRRQLDAIPLPKRGRSSTDVQDDIEDRPPHDYNELPLRLLQLIVEPTKSAANRLRVIVLDKPGRDSAFRELPFVI